MYNDFRQDMMLKLAELGVAVEAIGQMVNALDMVATRYTIQRQTQEIAIRGKDKLEECAKLYIICKQLEGCSKLTLQNYTLHIKGFLNYCGCPMEEIDANCIRRYLLLYKMDHQIGDRSLDKVRQDLGGWFRWMHDEGYIPRNPMANVAKIKHQIVRKPALDMNELERLRDACRDDRERCLVEVLYSTGCRISEALSIKHAEIRFDLPHPECSVIGKGKKERTVYFSPRAISAIKKYLATRSHESEWLFINERGGGQMDRSNVNKIFRQLRELAGLEDKRLTPHTMRHTVATQVIKIAPPQVVQQMLGHSKIDTTMGYADTCQDDVRNAHAKVVV